MIHLVVVHLFEDHNVDFFTDGIVIFSFIFIINIFIFILVRNITIFIFLSIVRPDIARVDEAERVRFIYGCTFLDLDLKLGLLALANLRNHIFTKVVGIFFERDQVFWVLGARHLESPVTPAPVAFLSRAPELITAKLHLDVLSLENWDALAIGGVASDLHARAVFRVAPEIPCRGHGGHSEHSDCELLEHC